MATPALSIQPVQLDDVPAIAQLCEDAFETDRQTQMKQLGGNPFSMKKHMLESLPASLRNPRSIAIKAVEEDTGEIMGFCNWGFRGISSKEMPTLRRDIDLPPADVPTMEPKTVEKETERKEHQTEEAREEHQEQANDPIRRLESLTGGDVKKWMEDIMPEGIRCLFIIGLSVSPKFQGRGVGSALLQFGTNFCDERGLFAWVHSSEPAWKMYEKCGFKTIRSLDVDLDEYAPLPPPNEGTDARWGHYIFRYMTYTPS